MINPFERGHGSARQVLSLFAMLFCLLCLPACADVQPVTAAPQEKAPAGIGTGAAAVESPAVAAEWQPLRRALAADGLSGPKVDRLLATLGPRTQDPMGRKMRELYRSRFMPRPKTSGAPKYYKGVVTQANAARCADYVRAHGTAFRRAERAWGVPPSTAAALLFVETRLGSVFKDLNYAGALHTLASMSQSRTFDSIGDWHARMPGCEKHRDWFAEIMPKRADWAYKETRALVRYMVDNGFTPDQLPGSIYGAIGLCQFMPSNIVPYGVDGDGDGVIDLGGVDDAVMSLAHYLHRHRWKTGASLADRRRVIMTYNKSTRYADTILALGDLVEKELAAGSGGAAAAGRKRP